MEIDIVDKLNIHMVYKSNEEFLRIDSENWFQGTEEHYQFLDDCIDLEYEFQEYLKQEKHI